MKRQPITSSNLKSVGYDADEHVLEVEFHNGSVYCYRGVPETVYSALCCAGSPGKYLNGVKDRYKCEKQDA